MSYKQKASANRDALFGSSGGGSSSRKKKPSNQTNRDALFGGGGSGGVGSSGGGASSKPASKPAPVPVPPSKGYQYGAKTKTKSAKPSLKGEAKQLKMKEAKECADKAKKAMQRGMFSKPDPLAASTYYKKAADAYQLCGETLLERNCRMSSGDSQMRAGAFATAAAEYTRAAEIIQDGLETKTNPESLERSREIGRKLHLDSAAAFTQMNEPSKAASSKVQAALALIWGDEAAMLPKVALEALEEAIEAHVPDPVNPYARYRQTGISAYIDPDSEESVANPSPETLALARQHIVDRPYAHEPVQDMILMMVNYGEYASALYAAGAASTILGRESLSSLTLSRAFVVETIVTLALGDPIAAEQEFLNRHVQKTSYLQSRECKLAEELFRAIKMRDGDALEEARSLQGSNRAAIGNLPPPLRELVSYLRLSGVARRGVAEMFGDSSAKSEQKRSNKSGGGSGAAAAAAPSSKKPEMSLGELAAQKTGYEVDDGAADAVDQSALQDELDALDFGDGDDSDDLSDDDDFDLR